MIDSIPPEFWPAAVVAGVAMFVWFIRIEVRAADRERVNHAACDPVVVTGSGHRSNRGVRSCGGGR